MSVLNSTLTEAVLKDCLISLEYNRDFYMSRYDDSCHCKKNLQRVIKQINAQKTTKSRHKIAQEYKEIIMRFNAETTNGRHICGHKWSTFEMVKHIDFERKKHLLKFYYSFW